ncbi:MAG: thymidine kinase [Nanoarchaeota archaeon]
MTLDLRLLRSKEGLVFLIHGPMFSGKSEELIHTLNMAQGYGGLKVQAFKQAIDQRYGNGIRSHKGLFFPASDANNTNEIKSMLDPDAQVYGISEMEFFDQDLRQFCLDLRKQGKKIILEGLVLDYRIKPFIMGQMGEETITTLDIYAISDYDIRLTAACVDCNGPAHFTRRNFYSEKQVEVGGAGLYSATCIDHHSIPRKP